MLLGWKAVCMQWPESRLLAVDMLRCWQLAGVQAALSLLLTLTCKPLLALAAAIRCRAVAHLGDVVVGMHWHHWLLGGDGHRAELRAPTSPIAPKVLAALDNITIPFLGKM